MRERKKMNKSNSRLESYPEIYLASFTRNGSYRNELEGVEKYSVMPEEGIRGTFGSYKTQREWQYNAFYD